MISARIFNRLLYQALFYAPRSSAPFHSTVSVLFSAISPVSRKNRSLNKVTVSSPPIQIYNFEDQATRLMHQIHDAVEGMEKLNETFILTADPGHEYRIDMGPKGVFIIRFKTKPKVLQFHSPISGILEYDYNQDQDLWLNLIDKHNFKGILTRDLLRVCVGCPAFK